MKVKYIYINQNNKYGTSHVISIPQDGDFPYGLVVDYDRMINRLVDMKIADILELLEKRRTINHEFW